METLATAKALPAASPLAEAAEAPAEEVELKLSEPNACGSWLAYKRVHEVYVCRVLWGID